MKKNNTTALVYCLLTMATAFFICLLIVHEFYATAIVFGGLSVVGIVSVIERMELKK